MVGFLAKYEYRKCGALADHFESVFVGHINQWHLGNGYETHIHLVD
jgi:hypothetical protein